MDGIVYASREIQEKLFRFFNIKKKGGFFSLNYHLNLKKAAVEFRPLLVYWR